MADPKGFLKYPRRGETKRPPPERVGDFNEFVERPSEALLREQSARCMDCGVPFCHSGCPVNNLIPEWNDLTYRGRMDEAFARLDATNNFPEITGRVCPAPCEAACVLNIEQTPVSIKLIERRIADHAIEQGLIRPRPAAHQRPERVSIVGSGPAGLAAAQQLARAGVQVTLYERDDRFGGLLMYGIPDFKLSKDLIDLRLEQLRAEGVRFVNNVEIGRDLSADELRRQSDALLLATGAPKPRDLLVPGRHLLGIEQAMVYLTQENRNQAGDWLPPATRLDARGLHVIVIGDGDTGADCVGTANRQGARSVTQFGRKAEPPLLPDPATPWPDWPFQLRTGESHEEGCTRVWSVQTKRFLGDPTTGRVVAVETVDVTWDEADPDGRRRGREVPGSLRRWPADLVLLAVGFEGPSADLMEAFGVPATEHGTMRVNSQGMTRVPGVFAAGDCVRGASLVVWAIRDGRVAADGILRFLEARKKRERSPEEVWP